MAEGSVFKNKCFITVFALLMVIVGLLCYTHYKMYETKKRINSIIEYKDSLNKYNKVYYESAITELKKHNRQLYDSLDASSERIDYLVEFAAKQKYSTGKVIIKEKKITDTVYVDSIKPYKTFEYCNVNPNDTMNYKLQINAEDEPNWYSLDITTSNKFKIVNKDLGGGVNHIEIGGNNGSTEIGNVTVFKKKKSFWKRIAIGPSVTGGYDVANKKWGLMVGASATLDITK